MTWFGVSRSVRDPPDTRLLAIANRESRIVLTRDRGFGELVYAERRTALGVILVRLKARNQWERLALLRARWREIEANMPGSFIVVMNDRLRIRPIQPRFGNLSQLDLSK